jgi:DNA-binding NarL/FixJ family response regulator
VVWDACRLESADLEWLRLLVANRPGVAVVILDSFPRGDSCRAALQAGAAAVLGRPVSLEALVGTLRGLSPRAAAV